MLPDELEWVLEMLGFHWPTADEDKLVRCAEVWERFAEDADRLHAEANRSTSTVVSHNAGESVDAFRAAYGRYDGDDGHLRNAAQAARTIAVALRAAAVVVETGKLAVIAQLVALAVELIATQAAAPFTLGLSELGSMGATAATRMVVRRLLDALRQALAEAIVECVKEPAVSAVEAMVTDLVRQSVNVGFDAQKGYEWDVTAQAGARGGWAAARQTPQTFLEGLRDGIGSRAGGAARNGLDGYLDADSPFRDGGPVPETDTGPVGDPGPLSAHFSLFSAEGPGLLGPDTGASAPADTEDSAPFGTTTAPDPVPVPDTRPGPGPTSGFPLPAPHSDGPSLPDFDDPAPSTPDGGGASPTPVHAPRPHEAPAPSREAGGSGPSLRTQIDSLAADSPTQTASAHRPQEPEQPPATPPRGHGPGTLPTPAPPAPTAAEPGPGGPAARASSPSTPPPVSVPPADGRPQPAPHQRPPAAPAAGSTPPQPGGGPRTPGAVPHQPGGGFRDEPGAHETAARHHTQPSTSGTQQSQTVAPPVTVAVRRRAFAGQPPGVPAVLRSGGTGAAGDDASGGRPAAASLHAIRADLAHEPGGLGPVAPDDQQALESSVPEGPDGAPERFPDPFGDWIGLQNDGGPEVPGRSNNSADCARSFLETWRGNPQVAAPRTLDPDEHGNPDPWTPEDAANENQIRWTGAPHTYAGPGGDPDTAARIEDDLLRAGHGAAALVQVDWPDGGGHAFNAVNHDGTVVWVDAQSGEVSHEPLHVGDAEHVWHIPMDPDGRPLHPERPDTADPDDDAPGIGGGATHSPPVTP